jgi:hypothetical protein
MTSRSDSVSRLPSPSGKSAAALATILSLILFSIALPAAGQSKSSPAAPATSLSFAGVEYLHRWSKDGQNEFTPRSDPDLSRWRDMVTINVNEAVRDGDQLAALANRVVGNYQSHGKIIRTDSKPRTPQRPAEHLIVAALGDPGFLEAAFARLVLIDGVGFIAVYSHRIYGREVGDVMSKWLATNGPSVEKTLMTWDRIPSLTTLKRLPQSR